MKINSSLAFAWMMVVLTVLLVLGLEMATNKLATDWNRQKTLSPLIVP
jgi:hypothetical protein